ncbi:MAG: ABC transporter ATP-binding protein [Candidatus Riflebacteria bacterium]|nr:ABC transporter ATP-binding protein [Candidatus Riflebacteria bacterium]
MKTFLRILAYFSGYLSHLAAVIFMSLVVAICTIYPAWIMKSVVNDVLVGCDLHMLDLIAISLIVIMGVKGIASYGQSYLMTWIGQSILRNIRSAAFLRLQQLSLAYYAKQQVGQIMSRITNDVLVLQNLLSSLTDTLGAILATVGFIGYIFYLHWKLATISVVIIPIIGAIINKYARKMKKIGTEMQNRIGDISTVLQEFIIGIKAVKSFTLEPFLSERFETANSETFKENMRGNHINSSTSPVIEFINTIGLAIIFWYGGYEVIHKRLDAGQLISFLVALVGLFTPIKNISKVSNIISQSVGAGDRVFEMLDAPIDILEKSNAKELKECRGAVDFNDVSFTYNIDEPILNHVSLSVAPGEVVALVGPSGAGKTTLVNLIPRFFEVQSGSVMVDGHDIRDLTFSSLRKQIGMVHQETLLFSGTIEDNIRLGRLDATHEAIVAAATFANANDFINGLPMGYNTPLGERGVNLSGGQAQRIALARAFLKDPPILVLDEATSALDSETENMIRESLARLMKNRTTFIIAHRLSTVINADKIVVMQNGSIVEWGTHTALLSKKGVYSHLYQAQYAHQKADLTATIAGAANGASIETAPGIVSDLPTQDL